MLILEKSYIFLIREEGTGENSHDSSEFDHGFEGPKSLLSPKSS